MELEEARRHHQEAERKLEAPIEYDP